MNNARIIKGRANSLMGSYQFIEGPQTPAQGNPWKPATLVIGETTVFTEQQVREILDQFSLLAQQAFLKRISGCKWEGQQVGMPSSKFRTDLLAITNQLIQDNLQQSK